MNLYAVTLLEDVTFAGTATTYYTKGKGYEMFTIDAPSAVVILKGSERVVVPMGNVKNFIPDLAEVLGGRAVKPMATLKALPPVEPPSVSEPSLPTHSEKMKAIWAAKRLAKTQAPPQKLESDPV